MKVLVTATNYSRYCQAGKKIFLDAGWEIVENPHGRPYTFEELKELVGDIDAVVAGVDTWNEEVFKLAPKLKVIARFGVGVDNICLEDAGKYGIAVFNSPGINTSAVAEQAVALMLCLTRKIPDLNAATRRGEWPRVMMHELKSRTVGLLGFGAIARDVSKKLRGFGPKIIAYDKFPNEKAAKELGVELVSMDEVLERSDIISIHLPALEDTKGIIQKETIAKMKEGVYLINTARGVLVREADVVEALESGKLAGYATDVYEQEPVTSDNPLFHVAGSITTPHTSAETYENCEQTSILTATTILDFLAGRNVNNRLC